MSVAALIVAIPGQVKADNLVLGVPDWNQPANYGIGGYPSWCAPTSGANLMGYWEDNLGLTGLADRQVYPNTPGYPANVGTWQQGLWHDGTIEMGWWMDTGNWRTNGGPFPPNAGGTVYSPADNIMAGLQLYATTGWADPGGLNKAAFLNVAVSNTRTFDQAMWNTYRTEINSARPVVMTFDTWVGAALGTVNVRGQSVQQYNFGATGAHTVVGVGYIDPTPAALNGDEWFIAQDNWPTGVTPQYVAVPAQAATWRLNDYFSAPRPPALRDDFNGAKGAALDPTKWTTFAGGWGGPGGYVDQTGEGRAHVHVGPKWTGTGFTTVESFASTGDYHIEGRVEFTRGTNMADNINIYIRNSSDAFGRNSTYYDYAGPNIRYGIHPTQLQGQGATNGFYIQAFDGTQMRPYAPGDHEIVWSGTNTVIMSIDYDAETGDTLFQVFNADMTDLLGWVSTTIDADMRSALGSDFKVEFTMDGYNSYDHYWDYVEVTPEPATLSLLALGGLAILRRRGRRR